MCKPQAITEQSRVFKMCVGPFQDRTAKRQIKGGCQREQGYMSNGGFGLSGREGLALPGRLKFKEKETQEHKREKEGGGRGTKRSKTTVKNMERNSHQHLV